MRRGVIMFAAVIRSTNAVRTNALRHARRGLAARPRRRAVVVKGHSRNAFAGSYDFEALVGCVPELGPHVIAAADSKGGRDTIDWGDGAAVEQLNRALLAKDYGVAEWSVPAGKLCPPVPSRADYVHHAADVLARSGGLSEPPAAITALDVGTGASLIYPLVGHGSYGWRFLASEVDADSVAHAAALVAANGLGDAITVVRQPDRAAVLDNVLGSERVDLVLCNPPFYESRDAFLKENARKRRGVAKSADRRNSDRRTRAAAAPTSGSDNFGGGDSELWTPGGERRFVATLIAESERYGDQCLWFSTLVSRQKLLPALEASLKRLRVKDTKVVATGRGQKTTTLLFWSFKARAEQRAWAEARGWAT